MPHLAQLTGSWRGPRSRSSSVSRPTDVALWLGSLGHGGSPLLTIEAPAGHRQDIYRWSESIEISKWRTKGIRNEVVWTTLHSTEPMVSRVLQSQNFVIDEPLKTMVDQKFYLISDLFRVILEARFQVAEGEDASVLVTAITRWILDLKFAPKHEKLFEAAGVSRRVTQTEQLDLVFFLAALAFQSGVIERLTLALDRVEMAATAGLKDRRILLKELDEVAFGATRWEKLGSPIGILVGVDKLAPLENSSPKLSKLLRSGVLHQRSV